jgi:hypothetical protein
MHPTMAHPTIVPSSAQVGLTTKHSIALVVPAQRRASRSAAVAAAADAAVAVVAT